jgi:hypothetical protein
MTHELKSTPDFFKAIRSGHKTFEIRENDRNFKVGDVLVLREFIPCRRCNGTGRHQVDAWESFACTAYCTCKNRGRFTGRKSTRKVTYMTNFKQLEGYVVMGIIRGYSGR